MNRREVIKMAATMLGGLVISPALARSLDDANWQPSEQLPVWASAADEKLLAEIAETIIPTTSTPGAKAAAVHKFILLMINDCYKKQEQTAFMEGLAKIESKTQSLKNQSFVNVDTEVKIQVLKLIEAEGLKHKEGFNFWRTLKELTMLGYFTSEIGATQALRYEWVPTRYDGNVTIDKNTKAWLN
jgi:hypothetical protein